MLSVIYYTVILVLTLIFIIPLTLLFLVTYPFDKERVALHYASMLWARGIFAINPLWSIKVTGRENIKKKTPYVVIVNHQAMFDIPLMYVLPFPFKWVSKKEVEKIPIFGMVLRMHGDISIERGTSKSASQLLEQGVARLSKGTSVNIFPEGTRSTTGQVGRFKEGAFLLAKRAKVDILPCIIEGTNTLTCGWRLKMPHRLSVRILPAIDKATVENTDIKALTEMARALYTKS